MAEVDVNMPDEERESCHCDAKQWPNIMALLATVGAGLLILVSVLNLMTFDGGIPGVMLGIYTIVLALLGFCAEMRMFKSVRSTIYSIIKYVYFLTSYYPRCLYYLFLGSIVLDHHKPLMLIAACYMMALSVMYAVLNCRYKFPKYLDWQVVKAEQEARLRREIEKRLAGTPTPTAAADAAVGAAGAAQERAAAAGAGAAVAAKGAYSPKENPYDPPAI